MFRCASGKHAGYTNLVLICGRRMVRERPLAQNPALIPVMNDQMKITEDGWFAFLRISRLLYVKPAPDSAGIE